ncbi:MAG: hypothetical protein R3B40_08775 [Polyangiales bacterium]|nr:hypothetical protein [Myxococcales bacterium]MCB9656300.1 hypothetical protein [Sandaracinaceae bacterium]
MFFGHPNLLAYAALFLFIPVTLALYARLSATKATIVAMLAGVLFLPEVLAIDPPLLPPMDKTSITAAWALVGCLWKARRQLVRARPLRGIDGLFVLLLLCNVGTALTNPDPLVTGPIVRPGLVLYDAVALGIKDTLAIYLPFLLGRAMVTQRRDLHTLLSALLSFGLVYACLALVEIRLSPQLHNWLYGYHQMDFSMAIRFGGYRPMIFMQTGLAVGMFMLAVTLAAIALRRTGNARARTVVFLAVVLVLCKSTGAILYALVVLPVAAFVRRPRARLPAALALLTLLYPLLRTTDTFPTDTLVEQAERINEERALSLWFRFDQEFQLLQRALERPYFGWGGYNRNRHFDPETGEDLSVTDGDWTIQIGTRGLVGFVALYGLLTVPVLLTWRRLRRIRSRDDRLRLCTLALITALWVVDLLPNGLFHCLPFFFAGALYGLLHGIADTSARQEGPAGPPRRRRTEAEVTGVQELEALEDVSYGQREAMRIEVAQRRVGLSRAREALRHLRIGLACLRVDRLRVARARLCEQLALGVRRAA